MYIWEQPDWPRLTWQDGSIAAPLAAVRHDQGRLIGRMEALGFKLREEAVLQTLTQDVVKTSEIEGEQLNVESVRSSIARRLGVDIGALAPVDRHIEGVVEMVLDATANCNAAVTRDRLFGWHAALFPTGYPGLVDRPELLDRFAAAARAIGLPVNADMNGPERECYATFQQTRRGQRRVSAARAYLVPALARPNLRMIDRALVLRVVVEAGRATGVAIRRGGEERVIRARFGVVLAAGAIGSPQILMLSGIGPADELARHGIAPLFDSPGVGRNLQDHFIARMTFRLADHRWSANRRIVWPRLGLEVLRWAFTGRGVLTWSPGMMLTTLPWFKDARRPASICLRAGTSGATAVINSVFAIRMSARSPSGASSSGMASLTLALRNSNGRSFSVQSDRAALNVWATSSLIGLRPPSKRDQ